VSTSWAASAGRNSLVADEIAAPEPSKLPMTGLERWCTVAVVDARGLRRDVTVIGGQGRPDIAAVDEVARAVLAAQRRGERVLLTDVSLSMRELLELSGLGVEMEG
jgi:hypothetical protein